MFQISDETIWLDEFLTDIHPKGALGNQVEATQFFPKMNRVIDNNITK